jgi:SAM-dependent methyltransferase
MSPKLYTPIVQHYESCLAKHGDSHRGVDWPNKQDADKRYQVMLDIVSNDHTDPPTLLDFGCGAAHLYAYLLENNPELARYSGLDISSRFIDLSRQKYPELTFYCLDMLEGEKELPDFDYIVMNGVFTEKCNLSFDEMFDYFRQLLRLVFKHARIGIAFNVMSKQVEWERDDLFHLPFETLAGFLTDELSRHFVIRQDYGLYEYTTYLYRLAAPLGT